MSGCRLVVSMSTKKVHRETCRYAEDPGSASMPFTGEDTLDFCRPCGTCKPTKATAP